MSAAGMSRTVLATGLAKVADKFIDPAANELPDGSPEEHSFMQEAALYHGFEMIDDDACVYVCNSRQIVALLAPMKAQRDEMLRLIGTCELWAQQVSEQSDVRKGIRDAGAGLAKELRAAIKQATGSTK